MLHIVIISYCSWQELAETLASIQESQAVECQLHVVDNLGDAQIETALNAQPSGSYYAFDNPGYGGAFNRVIPLLKLQKDDLVIVANHDIRVEQFTIRELINGYQMARQMPKFKVGMVCPVYKRLDGSEASSFVENRLPIQNGLNRVDFSPAAMWLMDYGFLKSVGGFVPNYFMYSEDRELAYRSKFYGYTAVEVVDAIVYHDFDYPPKDEALRLELETNTISTQFLNVNTDKTEANAFVLKSLLSALTQFNFHRFRWVWLGYRKFLRNRKELQQTKNIIEDKLVEFRFIEED